MPTGTNRSSLKICTAALCGLASLAACSDEGLPGTGLPGMVGGRDGSAGGNLGGGGPGGLGAAIPGRGGSSGSGGASDAGGPPAGGAGGTGSPSPHPDPDAGAAPAPDAATAPPSDALATACPATGPIDDSWLAAYQADILGRLTGKTPYAEGKSLSNRGTSENRAIARQVLAQMFKDVQLAPLLDDYGNGANLYAVLPSTTGNPERVVVGAHFDTVNNTPGASDNATGIAAVLAIARATGQLTCRNRAVVFVMFDQEEIGLVGSAHFADKLASDGVPVHSVHTIDQLGWDEDQDHLIELERPDAPLRTLYENAVTALGLTVPLSSTRTRSSDHQSFRPRWKAVGVTEEFDGNDTSPHRHRVTDTYDTVDRTYLRTGTTVVMRVIRDLVTLP